MEHAAQSPVPQTSRAGTPGDESVQGPRTLDASLAAARPGLLRFARTLCRSRAGLDPEDLVQDACARALRAHAQLLPGAPVEPWLRKILLRVTLDAIERRGRGPAALADADHLAAPAEHDEAHERREDVERLLASLTPDQREVLVRFHQREEPLAEIAAALALPVNTVKSHLHRARLELARRLRPEDLHDD